MLEIKFKQEKTYETIQCASYEEKGSYTVCMNEQGKVILAVPTTEVVYIRPATAPDPSRSLTRQQIGERQHSVFHYAHNKLHLTLNVRQRDAILVENPRRYGVNPSILLENEEEVMNLYTVIRKYNKDVLLYNPALLAMKGELL